MRLLKVNPARGVRFSKRRQLLESVYSPTAATHGMSGMRISRRRSWKRSQALQMTMRSLNNTSTEYE